MRRRPSKILNQWGRPYGYYEGGQGYRRSDMTPSHYAAMANDHDSTLPIGSWRQLLNSGRFLYANMPIVRGALREQVNLSLPLEPQYTGADKEWGERAEAWLREWHRVANIAGPAFDWETNCSMLLLGVKVDGDIGTNLVNTSAGYPQIQFVRAHRIKRMAQGENWHNGVRLNRDGRPTAYSINQGGTSERSVTANNFILTYRPEYSDQHRGISHLAASIRSFEDLKMLRQYEMRAQRIASAIALIEKNEMGEADDSSDALKLPDSTTDTSNTASGLVTETFEEGMVKYFKSGTGSGLEAFRSDRPSTSSMEFESRIVAAALYGCEWDPNFALALKEPGGAYARTVIEKVRRSIQKNQRIVGTWCRRVDGWAIAKAIKLGELPEPPDGDWFSWEYQGPPRLTADSGNEEKSKQEGYKLGLRTLKTDAAERGKWWQEEREQKAQEARDLLERARELAAQYAVSVEYAANLLEQRAPNPPTNNQQPNGE